MFHDKSGHRLDRFVFEDKPLPFVPAPGLFIFAHAAQKDFLRQLLTSEREQLAAELSALIFRGNILTADAAGIFLTVEIREREHACRMRQNQAGPTRSEGDNRRWSSASAMWRIRSSGVVIDAGLVA